MHKLRRSWSLQSCRTTLFVEMRGRNCTVRWMNSGFKWSSGGARVGLSSLPADGGETVKIEGRKSLLRSAVVTN